MSPSLALPDHLREIWVEICAEFHNSVGASGMEAICGQVYLMRTAQEKIFKEGVLVQDPKTGSVVDHPAIKVETSAQAAILRWRDKFGK